MASNRGERAAFEPDGIAGTGNARTVIAAIAPNIPARTLPSSGSSAFVSHAKPTQAHQIAARTRSPCPRPRHVRSSAMSCVTWVIAKTTTRSKKSSRGCDPLLPLDRLTAHIVTA